MYLPTTEKFKKRSLEDIQKHPWDLKNFLFSQGVAFRLKDKKLMRLAFRLWFDDVIKTYGKSKWIEVMVFTRKEK